MNEDNQKEVNSDTHLMLHNAHFGMRRLDRSKLLPTRNGLHTLDWVYVMFGTDWAAMQGNHRYSCPDARVGTAKPEDV